MNNVCSLDAVGNKTITEDALREFVRRMSQDMRYLVTLITVLWLILEKSIERSAHTANASPGKKRFMQINSEKI